MKAMPACADEKTVVKSEDEARRRPADWIKLVRALWGADASDHVSTVAMICPVPACPPHGR